MQTAFTFSSEGARVAGVLHQPTSSARGVIVLTGPFTSVKEQAASAYAEAMARRGYAALAFDHRHFGESEGEPRQLESPAHKIADIKNAVTALQENARTRGLPVAAIGVCAGGGYMARATAEEPRIRAFAGVAATYIDGAASAGGADPQLERGRAAERRWTETGVAEMIPAVGPDNGDVAMPLREAYEFYGTPRGAMPNYTNGFAVQSYKHLSGFDAMGAAALITVPTFVVHGERALMPAEAHRFFASLNAPKGELWLSSQGQIDFYDDPRLIEPAADFIAAKFGASLV
jgi:fermentation-respiration switch protein FrsA (DUF1100 family)